MPHHGLRVGDLVSLAARDEQARLAERLERALDVGAPRAERRQDLLELLQRQRAAGEADGREHLLGRALRLAAGIEGGHQPRPDEIGHAGHRRAQHGLARRMPRALAPRERTGLGPAEHGLHQQKRHARRALDQDLLELGRERRHAAHQLARLVGVERSEREAGGARADVALDLADEAGERGAGMRLVTRRHHDQHAALRLAGRALGQKRQQRQGGLIGPLRVVEQQQDRLAEARLDQGLFNRLDGRGQPFGSTYRVAGRSPRERLADDAELGDVGHGAAQRAKHAPSLLEAAGVEHGAEAIGRGRLTHGLEHAPAADPLRTGEHHHGHRAGAAELGRSSQHAEHRLPAHQRGALTSRHRRCRILAGQSTDGTVELGALAMLAGLGVERAPGRAGRMRRVEQQQPPADLGQPRAHRQPAGLAGGVVHQIGAPGLEPLRQRLSLLAPHAWPKRQADARLVARGLGRADDPELPAEQHLGLTQHRERELERAVPAAAAVGEAVASAH